MGQRADDQPGLSRLRGVVAPEILAAAELASRKLREAGISHALAGGLAVGAHGYPRTTDDVNFLVGDDAFVKHAGGLVTHKLPIFAVGKVRIDLVPPATSGLQLASNPASGTDVRVDFVPIDESKGETEQLRPAVDSPPLSGDIPIVPLTALVYMKLKAGRQKDIADLVELLKRGRIEVGAADRYIKEHAPGLARKWDHTKEIAAKEE
jgi:hypothetical protein